MNVTKTYINQLKPLLTERDFAIIEEVGRFKLLTGDLIERLFFYEYLDPETGELIRYSDKSRSRGRQQVLRRLVDHRILARVGERRIGGAPRGSASYLYMLDVAGQRIASVTSSQPRRPYVPYKPNQDHYLAVAELYVRLVEADRARQLTLLDFKAEPYCWRTFGERTLQPDAFVQVGIEQDGRRLKGSFFIEVDRGDQWGTKISSKFPQYVAYWRHERAGHTSNGRAFPRVLLLAPTPRRVAYLNGLIAEQQSFCHLFQAELVNDAVDAIGGGRDHDKGSA